MRNKVHENSGQYPPEFHEWLKVKKIPKKLRRDPEDLDQQFQAWRKLSGKDTPLTQSLFRIPKISVELGTIANQRKTVSELLETLHHADELIRPPKNDKDELL
jgi:hypothetical protein